MLYMVLRVLSEFLFVDDVSIGIGDAPMGDVAVLAADADSALCDSSSLCLVRDGVALVVYL